jgi:hypothetical protein
MRNRNPILTALNVLLKITNLRGDQSDDALDGLPLGTVGASATGELALKTILVGGTPAGAGTSTTPSSSVLTTQGASVTVVKSSAIEASHVLKSSAGQLVSFSVISTSAGVILIMDSATLPANGAVTLLYPPIPVEANKLTLIDFLRPLVAANGITYCISDAVSFTKTIQAATCIAHAQLN